MRLKIDLYRRLARVTHPGELEEFRAELSDRFGPPPAPVERMLARAELKIDAAIWQIAEIYLEDRFLVFRYTDRPRIEQLAKLSGGKLRVVDQDSAYLRLPEQAAVPDAILALVKSVLRPH